jgi:Domain of unknown function (DUF6894)
MPRYFFDVDDGGDAQRDEVGTDLGSLDEVRAEAISLLPNIARDEVPDGDNQTFAVLVRDDSGRPIFEASLVLSARWLNER